MEVMFLDKYKHDKGSYTVEISMMFTLIVFVILTLLFTFLYMQQKASLVSAASFAAQQGAELWMDSRSSMENGEVDKAESADSIYYRVFDNLLFSTKTFEGYFEEVSVDNGKKKLVLHMDVGDSLPGQKVALIGEALCKRIESTVLKPRNTKVRITYTNNALRGRLYVEIIQEITVPLGGIKAFFDGKDTLTLKGQSTSTVSEPDEYIRNIDLAIELSKRLGSKLDFPGLIDKVKAKGQK
jgi:hypothetical protein